MAISVTHSKHSAVADGPDPSLVQPTDWNAEHVVTGALDPDVDAGAFSVLSTDAFPVSLHSCPLGLTANHRRTVGVAIEGWQVSDTGTGICEEYVADVQADASGTLAWLGGSAPVASRREGEALWTTSLALVGGALVCQCTASAGGVASYWNVRVWLREILSTPVTGGIAPGSWVPIEGNQATVTGSLNSPVASATGQTGIAVSATVAASLTPLTAAATASLGATITAAVAGSLPAPEASVAGNIGTGVAPSIAAFVLPDAATALANIPITTLTTSGNPTEYAVIVQPYADAAPSTPTTGWSGTVPTTVTAPGAVDGRFTAYVWCRNSNGTSSVATASVLVLQSNATSLSNVTILTASTARVTFNYAFASAAEANDWDVSGAASRSVSGGSMTVSGGEGNLRTVRWHGLTSRTAANSVIQLESATSTVRTAGATSLGNLIVGHATAYAGSPYNPNPGIMLTKRMWGADYEIDVNGADEAGGTQWTPTANTDYDFTYTLSTTSLSIAVAGHGSQTRTTGQPFAIPAAAGHVSIGHYGADSVWANLTLTGIVSF